MEQIVMGLWVSQKTLCMIPFSDHTAENAFLTKLFVSTTGDCLFDSGLQKQPIFRQIVNIF